MDNKLNFREHINVKINKGNSIVGIIRRSFTHLTKEIVTKLFKSLVRPHLEYCHAVWKADKKMDMQSLERVQSRATALVPELKEKCAMDRLKELKLPCMAYRSLRGDMVETYKILQGKYDDESEIAELIEKAPEARRTRGHSLKIQGKRWRTNIMKFNFSNRKVGTWNR